MRTGRKSYEELLENTEVALVPIRKIAERSGLCERTVSKHLQNGLSKLAGMPFNSRSKVCKLMEEAVLAKVYAVATADYHPPLQATSLECQKDVCALFSEGGSDEHA
jgi:hypothetical protein